MSERVLEINDLHVSFDIEAGEVQAVRGVDLYLDKGETLAIVGE
ncbi:ABC transporter ATP-binding protein, partial [Staphylococcus pseudintermedius]|nr:ABC transporter ATP-binding protein [Staphylococcus pseudintermedius]